MGSHPHVASKSVKCFLYIDGGCQNAHWSDKSEPQERNKLLSSAGRITWLKQYFRFDWLKHIAIKAPLKANRKLLWSRFIISEIKPSLIMAIQAFWISWVSVLQRSGSHLKQITFLLGQRMNSDMSTDLCRALNTTEWSSRRRSITPGI